MVYPKRLASCGKHWLGKANRDWHGPCVYLDAAAEEKVILTKSDHFQGLSLLLWLLTLGPIYLLAISRKEVFHDSCFNVNHWLPRTT